MYSVDRWYAAFVQAESYELVGRQHELFDQFVCRVMRADDNALNMTGGIHEDLRLRNLKIDTAIFEPFLPKQLAEMMHIGQSLYYRVISLLFFPQQIVNLGIGEASMAFDDGGVKYA